MGAQNSSVEYRYSRIPCMSCRRIVIEIPDHACRRYGLLEHCFHVFCLQCIRQFNIARLKEIGVQPGCPKIVCPYCGLLSSHITACRSFPMDPEVKRKKFHEMKETMKTIPCPYLKHGVGECLCEKDRHKPFLTPILEMDDKFGFRKIRKYT